MSKNEKIDYTTPKMQKKIKEFQNKLADICVDRWLMEVNSDKIDTHLDFENDEEGTGKLRT